MEEMNDDNEPEEAVEGAEAEAAEAGAAADVEGAQIEVLALEKSQYGNNTTSKKAKRRLSFEPKGVWVHIKRIKDPDLREVREIQDGKSRVVSGHSHVCILCGKRMNLTIDKDRGAFITSIAVEHMKESHPEEPMAKASEARTQPPAK